MFSLLKNTVQNDWRNDMVKVKVDMTGWVMSEHGFPDSRLTVIQQVEDYVNAKGRHYSRWLCECSCEDHSKRVVRGSYLTSGHTQSCGCLMRETSAELGRQSHKSNIFDLSGEYGIGWTSNTNQPFYFDLEDYDLIKDYCWHESECYGMHRLETQNPITHRKIRMHVLLGFKWCDHINRNELDNRKSNLRVCTRSQNQQNRSIDSRNVSGVTGVVPTKFNTWRASLIVKKKEKLGKCFKTKEEAIIARLNAEVEYFGEFAPQRHLYEQYGIETIQND